MDSRSRAISSADCFGPASRADQNLPAPSVRCSRSVLATAKPAAGTAFTSKLRPGSECNERRWGSSKLWHHNLQIWWLACTNFARSPELRPSRFDSCDWRFMRDRPGPAPAYWEFACHRACHWTANLSLFVAMKAEPKCQWRLVTSQKHTTVWDGKNTLWDTNFSALGVPPDEAWELAAHEPDSEHLAIGEYMLHW